MTYYGKTLPHAIYPPPPPRQNNYKNSPTPTPWHTKKQCNFSEMLNQSWTNHEESNNRGMKV